MSQVSDKLKIKGVLCITGVLKCSVLYFSKLKILKTEKVQSTSDYADGGSSSFYPDADRVTLNWTQLYV